MFICQYCGKECKNANSLRNHERLCKQNPDRQTSWLELNQDEITVWNKGLTKYTDARLALESLKRTKPKSEWQTRVDDDGKLKQRYYNKQVNARAENIDFELTFYEYCLLVWEAGLVSSQLGFTGENYVLGRYNDCGPYAYGNCRFITQKENSDEKNARLFSR